MPRQVGVFVKAGEQPFFRPLVQRRAVAVADEQDGSLLDPARLFCRADGKFAGQIVALCHAPRSKRANGTLCFAVRHANAGAQFDQRLRKRAGTLRNDHAERVAERRLGFGQGNVGTRTAHAGKHAQNVAVHSRGADAESDGSNGAGGIIANAGQFPDFFLVGGHDAVIFLYQKARRFLQVACAAVIAKPFPKFEEFFLRRGGKVAHRGERGKKALVVGLDRLHARLLEHDLRDPDAVGVARFPPGQVARVGIVPTKERVDRFGRQDGRGFFAFQILRPPSPEKISYYYTGKPRICQDKKLGKGNALLTFYPKRL